jgi:hypothetical protein
VRMRKSIGIVGTRVGVRPKEPATIFHGLRNQVTFYFPPNVLVCQGKKIEVFE